MGAFGDAIGAVIKILPATQKAALVSYTRRIGTTVSKAENVSIVHMNRKELEENSCFKDLTVQFYSQLQFEDSIHSKKKGVQRRPSLADSSKSIHKKDGWLWQMAMEYANQNSRLALALIGVCGHDDKSQIFVEGDEGTTRDRLTLAEEVGLIQAADSKKIKEYLARKNNLSITSPEIAAVVAEIEKMDSPCPKDNSSLYYPGSLGEEFDIAAAQKVLIANELFSTPDLSKAPAKNYHIMGAARTSCDLVAGQVPDFVSQMIVTTAARGYRQTRFCQHHFTRSRFDVPFVEVDPKLEFTQLFSALKRVQDEPGICGFEKGSLEAKGKPSKKSEDKSVCKLWSQIGLTNPLHEANVGSFADLANSLQEEIATADLAAVFKAQPLFQSANQCQGLQYSDSVERFFKLANSLNSKLCGDLAKSRCELVLQKMKKGQIDIDWTVAQHQIGLEFAKKHCRKDFALESDSCSAVDKVRLNLSVPKSTGTD
jgi:hypothetical protein